MRLDKFLESKNYPKKAARKLFKKQLICVNGKVPQSLGANIDPFYQEIKVEDMVLKGEPHHYILLNKPQGMVTANFDKKYKTVMDLLPEELKSMLRFSGRLDKDTEGLIFLTDNGLLNYRMHQDRFNVTKTYLVETKEPMEKEDVQKAAQGLVIDGEVLLLPAKLEILGEHIAKITITQGKYHQVKKMFLTLGKKVVFLKRIAIGKLVLPKDLKIGQWKELSSDEFKKIEEFFY